MSNLRTERVTCCIAGAGPAGAMLALLLARAGVDVLLLEKHADFLRDFRGDTIHPSTLELMASLGLADKVLALRHSKATTVSLETAEERVVIGDFTRLRTAYPYVAFVAQWDFLDLITGEAKAFPNFRLLMSAEARQLVIEDGVVRGLLYHDGEALREVRADVTIDAEGRSSRLRKAAGLVPAETSAAMDVLWFRLSRRPDEPHEVAVRLAPGFVLVLVNRFEYWQVAYLITKGSENEVRAGGLDAFRASLARSAPELADRVHEIQDWDGVKLLTVRSNRLRRWYQPGYLCIGDAAHAMSPAAGVGINLAIQDAVVTANTLARPLRRRKLRTRHLWEVQARRWLPIWAMQVLQRFYLATVETPALEGQSFRLPRGLSLFNRVPALRWLPAKLVGHGVWRVHLTDELRDAA